EEFHYDKELVDLFEYYSTGDYGSREVELILNGDVFDFLAIPFVKYFDDEFWSEKASLEKFKMAINAHREVIEALGKFAGGKKKKIVYIIGNHDAELVFESLRNYFFEQLPVKSRSNVEVLLRPSGEYIPVAGVLVKHGHEYDISNNIDFKKSIIEDEEGAKYFLPPWGSYFVTRILNKFKEEKSEIDAVRPIKKFLINGLIYDSLFTIRFIFSSLYYFFMIRFLYVFKQQRNFKTVWAYLRDDFFVFKDYEAITYDIIKKNPGTNVLIMGHTHMPAHKVYPDGKVFINTGTWVDMHYLDFERIRDGGLLTYAQIDVSDSKNESEEIPSEKLDGFNISLNAWKGRNELPFVEF
ncbi:MAG: hypothetical protein A2451_15710, partial [Bdellovibrionales bacterium RIFOXYC2_FULL_39_8]